MKPAPRVAAIVVALTLAATTAMAEPAWVGTWAMDGPSCATDPVSYTIAEITAEELYCEILAADLVFGTSTWLVQQECHHGEIFRWDQVLTVTPEGRLVTIYEDGTVFSQVRCR